MIGGGGVIRVMIGVGRVFGLSGWLVVVAAGDVGEV